MEECTKHEHTITKKWENIYKIYKSATKLVENQRNKNKSVIDWMFVTLEIQGNPHSNAEISGGGASGRS